MTQPTPTPKEVIDNLRQLDGSTRSAVRLVSGTTDEELDALGGFGEETS
mgnify:CR=1 FL=1